MKLIEALAILRRTSPAEAETFRVFLACGFNPLHLQTMLAAQLRLLLPERRTEIQTGLYGDFRGNFQALAKARPDAGVVLLEWPDLDPRLGVRRLGKWAPSVPEDIVVNVRATTSQIEDAVRSASGDIPLVLCLPTLPLPPIFFNPGWQASAFDLAIRAYVYSLCARVANNSNVKVLNPQRLDRLSPPPDRFDVESEVRWGFPYRLPHAATLAELLGQLIKGPVPKKGLITDLDDTLWKGVLGEVGSEEVSWDLDHDSHMHGLYQQLVHSLSVEGVLVGVASKNDPAYVEEVFRRNDVMLPSSAIFPMEVHWGPKSESVARILKTWNVGPDSVVFVDDSPMELAEVKAAHPEVECLQFPSKKHEAVLNLLDRLRDLFGKAVMSEEDAIRLDSIRQNQFNRDDGPRTAGSPSAFLQQANAELLISFRKDPLDPRALELVNKTNQFNLNGKRYTQLSWRNYLQGPCSFLLLAAYKDKYGPLGKIAVIAGRQKERTLFVDTWVMSCRAFGRRIEHRCLEELYAKYGIDEIEFDFAATGRNEPLRTFLADILDAPPSAGCRLPRDQFLDRRLETFHHVQEVNNG